MLDAALDLEFALARDVEYMSTRQLADQFIQTVPAKGVPFGTYAQSASLLVSLAQIICLINRVPATRSLNDVIAQHNTLVRNHLAALHAAYSEMCELGHGRALQQIWNLLGGREYERLLRETTTLPDLYLDLKAKLEAPTVKSRYSHAKVRGQEYFLRTQFFTEPYMATFLVAAGLKAFREPVVGSSMPVILDPACGAGSMLIAAFKYLVQLYTGADTEQHIDRIFAHLVGYDLDPAVAQICRAALTVTYAALTQRAPNVSASIHHDITGDGRGFFVDSVAERLKLSINNRRCLLITNPPFLGRRLMDMALRDYLHAEFPESKGDLCTAFMMRCVQFLSDGDVCSVVHQSTFWHLSSLSSARRAARVKVVVA